MKRSLFLIFSCLVSSICFAQLHAKVKVDVKVLGVDNASVEGATTQLLRKKDSSTVKVEVSDKNGNVSFENIPGGEYFIKTSMLHYKAYWGEVFTITDQPLSFTMTLTASAPAQLSNVTVTTQKPFIERLTDRIVVNVENSIVNAGSTAFEVLERSPAVTIDQNDNISLRGKTGVIIMVDGRITPMTGADLANYLRSLPSNAIDRIEIITNPSARYDAAGNSGIIDIKMKKDQRLGTNGTFNAGYGQGVYPKANAGLNLNYRNKGVNVFGNYNFNYRKGLNHLLIERNFYRNGSFIGGDEKNNYTTFPFKTHVVRVGADFFPSKKTIVGFVVNSNFTGYTSNNDNSSIVLNNFKQPANTFNTSVFSRNHLSNTVANLNYKHTFDSTGKELIADADYGIFNSDSRATTTTRYFQLNGSTQKPTYILQGDQDGELSIKTAKVDYVNPLRHNARFEVGAKTSFVSSDNDARFFDVSTGRAINDSTKTNRFKYEENNNAGYVNYNKQFKKFGLQVGLRGEQTNVKTLQVKGNKIFDSSYFQLFPSAFFNYKLKDDRTVGLSVSRRIDRPGYSSLNPFLFLIDVSTYNTGSPGLLPQITWSYEMSYTLKQLNFTLGYSHTKDVQSTVIVPFKDVFPNIVLADTNVTVQIPVNLTSQDYLGLSVSAPVRISKWWSMINNGNFYYIKFKGNLAKTPLNNGSPVADISTNNTFTFNKGWSAELSLRYNSGGRNAYMVAQPQYGVGAGVQKSVLKKNGTVRFNVTDIFWTNLPKATITYTNYIENWHAYRETRVANLTFTYRFGNNKVAAARRRATASEEERRRAGGN